MINRNSNLLWAFSRVIHSVLDLDKPEMQFQKMNVIQNQRYRNYPSAQLIANGDFVMGLEGSDWLRSRWGEEEYGG
jgi:hypothetical protein